MGKKWLSASLEQKIRSLGFCAATVVFLSIMANILVARYGMAGFGSILESNSQSMAFWSAMDEETRAFKQYVTDRTEESFDKYRLSSKRSARAVKALPFDCRRIGKSRYAKTWSIRNTYENYERLKEHFFELEGQGQEQYMDLLYTIYRAQEYLEQYAGTLVRMNVEQGKDAYEDHLPALVVVPGMSILFGAVVLLLLDHLRRRIGHYFIQPVVRLAEDSRRIGENDFSGPDVQAECRDEMGELIQAFSGMKASTKGYIQALKEKHEMEKQLDSMQLQMLKSQINPHFLFNTLNMIASMAQIEDAAATEKMITALSRLFRYNLKSSGAVMPLGRELSVVQDYMYLQTMRFGARIRYTTDCKEDTLEVLVPSFALQPLVENAVKHGLSAISQGGRIHVRSWMKEGRLWISVADTGAGIGRERLREIKRALAEGQASDMGIGISNIYRRLHAMYEDGEMFLYSREGCGTAVQLAFSPSKRDQEG